MTIKLSTGDESTLGNWRMLSAKIFGEDSAATKFIDEKIAASPGGEAEPVLAAESQFLHVLLGLAIGEQ